MAQIWEIVTDAECKRADIPLNPLNDPKFDEALYDYQDSFQRLLDHLPEKQRDELAEKLELGNAFNRLNLRFEGEYQRYTELFKAEIYTALRKGQLKAYGIEMPHPDLEKANALIDLAHPDGWRMSDLPTNKIPADFWSLKTTNFEDCYAVNDHLHYRLIHVGVSSMLAFFPVEEPSVKHDMTRVGDFFLVSLPDLENINFEKRKRGRPPYPWGEFHVEIAALVSRDGLPKKKEAAIQYFIDWFRNKHNQSVSRSTIGEKLKPYYDRLVKKTENN